MLSGGVLFFNFNNMNKVVMESIHPEIGKVYTFGKTPKILLIAGMHGDEKTGPYILRKLIADFKVLGKNMPVSILSVVNKDAYKNNSRISLKDGKDLNRIFPAKGSSRHSTAIAQALYTFSRSYEVVIDFHVFVGQKTMLCGVELNTGTRQIRIKTRQLMSMLGMQLICAIDKTNEPKKQGSLCGLLQSEGCLAFGIELPPIRYIKKTQVETLIGLCKKIIKKYPKLIKTPQIPVVRRVQLYAEENGTFTSLVSPGDYVKATQPIGKIRQRNNDSVILSPVKGIVVSCFAKKTIQKNQKAFVIGSEIFK